MASGRQVLDRCLMSRPMIGPMEGRGGMPLPRPVACSQRGGEASQEGMHTSQFLAEQGRSYLCSLSDDMLFSVLQHGGPACLARLRATSSGISLRCGAQEPRLYHHFLCTAFAALVSETEECGDAGFSLVKLAVPCLTMVVEIRGETHATQSWVDERLVPHKPWDGDIGSIQELFYGVSTVKASSYKEAYKMCVRKHVEDAVSKAQMAVNEHDRRRQKLAFAMGAVRHELEHLSKACWRLRAERAARERQEILCQAKAREPNAWAPAPVRWAEAGREAGKRRSWTADSGDSGAATRRTTCIQVNNTTSASTQGAPAQCLATQQKTLSRDADAKKAQLVAKCKEFEGVDQECRALRHELKGLKRQLRKLGGREEVGGREEATPACASNMTHPHQQSTDASCQQCSKVAAATCRVVASSATLDFWGLCMQFP